MTYFKETKLEGGRGQENHYFKHYFTNYFYSPPDVIKALPYPPIWGSMPIPCKGSIHLGDSEHEAKTVFSSLPF